MRSSCPLNFALELFGDKWTLLIIRDIMFFNKHYFNEFLASDEKISSNILAGRLAMLEQEQFIAKEKDKNHKQKIRYYLTEKGIDLLPILVEIGCWSGKYGESIVDSRMHSFLSRIKEEGPESFSKMREALYSQRTGS